MVFFDFFRPFLGLGTRISKSLELTHFIKFLGFKAFCPCFLQPDFPLFFFAFLKPILYGFLKPGLARRFFDKSESIPVTWEKRV